MIYKNSKQFSNYGIMNASRRHEKLFWYKVQWKEQNINGYIYFIAAVWKCAYGNKN